MAQGTRTSPNSKATEDTLREIADAMPGGSGTPLATEAKQDDQITLETSIRNALQSGGYSASRLNDIKTALTNVVSTDNSYDNTVADGATITGAWEECLGFAQINVVIKTDRDSAVGGFRVEYSADGSTPAIDSDAYTISAGSEVYRFPPSARYFRFSYTNSAGAAAAVEIQTILRAIDARGSAHRVGDSISEEDDAELVEAVIKGFDGGSSSNDAKVTAGGRLKVTDGEPDRVTDDWSGAPWDGVAARKLTVRTGAGWVRIVSYQIPGGGGAGGATKRIAYFTEVGDGTSGAKVVSTDTAIASQINETPLVPRLILADANGQIDLHVVPDAGTTASSLDLDVVVI